MEFRLAPKKHEPAKTYDPQPAILMCAPLHDSNPLAFVLTEHFSVKRD